MTLRSETAQAGDPPACGDARCLGWFENVETHEIERCDECAIFPDDEAALVAARASGWQP